MGLLKKYKDAWSNYQEECTVFNVLHRDISVQQGSTAWPIYFQFISIINFYVFRAGLLLIIRRYCSVYTVIGTCHVNNNVIV
jgi:hypothetical protein